MIPTNRKRCRLKGWTTSASCFWVRPGYAAYWPGPSAITGTITVVVRFISTLLSKDIFALSSRIDGFALCDTYIAETERGVVTITRCLTGTMLKPRDTVRFAKPTNDEGHISFERFGHLPKIRCCLSAKIISNIMFFALIKCKFV